MVPPATVVDPGPHLSGRLWISLPDPDLTRPRIGVVHLADPGAPPPRAGPVVPRCEHGQTLPAAPQALRVRRRPPHARPVGASRGGGSSPSGRLASHPACERPATGPRKRHCSPWRSSAGRTWGGRARCAARHPRATPGRSGARRASRSTRRPAVAGFGGADDAGRVREQLVVVVGALDEELAALEPLEGDGAPHDAVEQRVGRLGGPRADQGVERLEGRSPLGHVTRRRAASPSRARG